MRSYTDAPSTLLALCPGGKPSVAVIRFLSVLLIFSTTRRLLDESFRYGRKCTLHAWTPSDVELVPGHSELQGAVRLGSCIRARATSHDWSFLLRNAENGILLYGYA